MTWPFHEQNVFPKPNVNGPKINPESKHRTNSKKEKRKKERKKRNKSEWTR
jgi:hypothetical protein